MEIVLKKSSVVFHLNIEHSAACKRVQFIVVAALDEKQIGTLNIEAVFNV